MCINTSEISKKSLESIIKVSGDNVVTGYRRFKKIKPVKGYKKACERARIHLSVIIKGVCLADGTYAVVVRYRAIVFLIPILIGLLFFFVGKLTYKADERDYIDTEIPTVVVAGDYEGMYIDIPGIKAFTVSGNVPKVELYNPAGNDCSLLYELYFDKELIGKSGYIFPGQRELVEIVLPREKGLYEIEIVTKGISLDMKKEYNSVLQVAKVNYI